MGAGGAGQPEAALPAVDAPRPASQPHHHAHLLGVVFFVVILPVALVMKVVGHDPMARKFDDKAKTYRVPSHKALPENMERPF